MRTDETTPPTRRREANERSARAINARIVGEAEDLYVSASRTAPFERPELGQWLTEPSRFDVILWWRPDRLFEDVRGDAGVGVPLGAAVPVGAGEKCSQPRQRNRSGQEWPPAATLEGSRQMP
ncbi:recombinase family protein [Streptomyces sp. NPDC020362]|uniref:recombinase family protein n=1 Tax=unclassified Streptomyces TaxID=2593676 RepID=UPI003405B15C